MAALAGTRYTHAACDGIAEPECNPVERIELNPTAEGPCYGPLSFPESDLATSTSTAPGLSADGYTVAFLAGSELRPDDNKPDALDIFTTRHAAGASRRKDSTSELTLAVNECPRRRQRLDRLACALLRRHAHCVRLATQCLCVARTTARWQLECHCSTEPNFTW